MSSYRYVRLDPTGNLTCLVLDPVPPEEEAAVTARLMEECEQVAYLEAPSKEGARARIRLMGGEFCGNAAMAAACYLESLEKNAPEENELRSVPLQVSGTDGVIDAQVKRIGANWQGTVEMPPVTEIFSLTAEGRALTAVRMDGIVHLIMEGKTGMTDAGAEALLKKTAGELPDSAAGLLQWNAEDGHMRPLVFVKNSQTLVWETGCGSGSCAIGVLTGLKAGDGIHETAVRQPGGTILVRSEIRGGLPARTTITGRVRLEKEAVLRL